MVFVHYFRVKLQMVIIGAAFRAHSGKGSFVSKSGFGVWNLKENRVI